MAPTANELYQGDCLEKLAELDAGSVDLVFADPPFNIGYEYDVYDDRRSQQDYLEWCRRWIEEIHRVLKATGSFWLAIGDEFAAELKVIAQQSARFHCRSWVIWYYTFGVNCVRGFSRSHTHLFHFVKDPQRFTFNSDNPAVRVLSARQLVYADARANSKGRLPDNTWILRPQDAPKSAFRPMHDTWYFARVAGTFKEREGFHGCQMPEQLLGRIIRVSSNPGDVVLDPFGGSGTTLAVAKKLGRQWLGIELSEEYAERIRARLDECRSGDPLDGPADPVRSAPATSNGKRRVRFRNGRPVPPLDAAAQDVILDAYRTVSDGQATDVVICDPALNECFVEECRDRKLPGDPYTWNRFLLRLRKKGSIPKGGRRARRLRWDEMDPFRHASEIAMQLMIADYGLALDEILCHPAYAQQLDAWAAMLTSETYSSLQYRWAALSVRKRAKRARRLALERFSEWSEQKLPPATALPRCAASRYERPGVYVLLRKNEPLYVGETSNIRRRLDDVQGVENWQQLAATAARVIPCDDQESRSGIQSALILRLNPWLNSRLLCADREVQPV